MNVIQQQFGYVKIEGETTPLLTFSTPSASLVYRGDDDPDRGKYNRGVSKADIIVNSSEKVKNFTTVNVPGASWPLRVKYLRGIINEKQFKRKIQQHDKLSSMNVEIGQILTTYVAAGTDILVSSVVHRDAKMTLQSTHSLIGFFNDVFCKLSRVYSMQTPNIDDKHYYIVDKLY